MGTFARVTLGARSSGSEKSVADPVKGLDVARARGVVAEPPAEGVDVPGKRVVAAERRVGAPEGRRDLAVRDPNASLSGKGVEDRVLPRRESYLARPLTNTPMQGVDLQVGDPQWSD